MNKQLAADVSYRDAESGFGKPSCQTCAFAEDKMPPWVKRCAQFNCRVAGHKICDYYEAKEKTMGAVEPIIKVEIEQVREKLTHIFRAHNDDIQRMVEKALEKYCTEEWLQQIVDKQVVELLEKASKASYEYSWTAMQAIDRLIGDTINKRIIAVAESPEPKHSTTDALVAENNVLRRRLDDICAERDERIARITTLTEFVRAAVADREHTRREILVQLDAVFEELGAKEGDDET